MAQGSTLQFNQLTQRDIQQPLTTYKGEESSILKAFFGDPIQKVTPSIYDHQPYTHHTLPKAFEGENMWLKDTVEGLLIDGDTTWQTTRALPWMHNNNLTVKMHIYSFEPGMINHEPHEGIPRLIQESQYTWQGSQMRWGLGFKFERDFYQTELGRAQYRRYILGIAKYVQERANHDVLYTILNSKTYENIWRQKFGNSLVSYKDVMDAEVNEFASAVDAAQGFLNVRLLYDQHRQAMGLNNVIPDLMIIPPGMRIFLAEANPKTLDYWALSNQGALILKYGPKAWTFDNQIDVVEAPDFSARRGGIPIQLLKRRTIICEYNTMYNTWRNYEDIYNYSSDWRHIYIYSTNDDNYKKICFPDAFKETKLFDFSGKVSDPAPYDNDLVDHVTNEQRNWYTATQIENMTFDGDCTGDKYKTPKQPFFLASLLDDETYALVTLFGHLEDYAIDLQDFVHMAQALVSKFCLYNDAKDQYQQTMEKFHRFIYELEDYDDVAGIKKYIETLKANNQDTEGNYPVSNTPEKLSHVRLEELQYDSQTGSIPIVAVADVTYPIGYNNGPGLRALAKANAAFPDIAKRAQEFVEFFEKFATFIRKMMPTCEAINTKHRDPWFHKEDEFATLYGLFAIDRAPIFINIGGAFADEPLIIAPDDLGTKGSDAITKITDCFKDVKDGQAHIESLNNFVRWYVSHQHPSESENQIDAILQYIFNTCESEDIAIDLKKNITALSSLMEPDSKKNKDMKKRANSMIQKAIKTISSKGKSKQKPISKASENWMRTPLTTSPGLERALKNESLAGIIAVGDPRTGYTTALTNLPLLEKEELLSKHNIFDVLKDPTLKKVDNMRFIQSSFRRSIEKETENNTKFKKYKDYDPIETFAKKRYINDEEDIDLILSDTFKKSPNIGSLIQKERQGLRQEKISIEDKTPDEDTKIAYSISRPALRKRWQEANTITDPLVQLFVYSILITPADDGNQWMKFEKNHVPVPVNILLWRLFIEHDMSSMILMKSGFETGATLHGNSGFSLGADTLTNTWHAHYTTYMKAMVWRSQNIHIVENIKPEKYRGGSNDKFIKKAGELRITGENNPREDRASIIATAVSIKEGPPSMVMGFKGLLDVPTYNDRVDPVLQNTYSTSPYYRKVWPLDNRNMGVYGMDDFTKRAGRPMFNAYQGMQASYNATDKRCSVWTYGQGHRGHNQYPGARKIWNGLPGVFQKFQFENLVLA